MKAHVFPMEPASADTWNALIAVEFPVPVAEDKTGATKREFGVVLQRGSEVAHTFHRTVTLGGGSAGRRLTFLEPAVLRPGRYSIHAVLADPKDEKPSAAKTDVLVPDIPKKRPFLVGPILGRRSGEDVVVYGGAKDRIGSSSAFRPLLVAETERNLPLAAFTQACIVKLPKSDGPWLAERSLLSESGEAVESMPGFHLAREGKSEVVCRKVFDELSLDALPLGRYTFLAILKAMDTSPVDDGTKRIPVALVGDGH